MSLSRKLDLLRFIFFPGSRKEDLKLQINLEYRRALAESNGVKEIEVENLYDWNSIALRLINPTSVDGQTVILPKIQTTG